MGGALVALVALGCGRVGYEARDGDVGVDATSVDGAPGDAGPDASEPPAYDYCTGIPPLEVAPVIDGALEPGLVLTPLVPVGWQGGTDSVPEGESASFAVGWRPEGLYVYVAVVDPTRLPAPPGHDRWCGDGVEVYVDADGLYPNAPYYDDAGTRQFTTGAPGDDSTPESTGEMWCYQCDDDYPILLTSTAFVAVPRPGGYALEMFVVAADLGLDEWSLAAGARAGFDLAVNVSDPDPTTKACNSSSDGQRLGQYFLRVADSAPREPYRNVGAFCTATLLE